MTKDELFEDLRRWSYKNIHDYKKSTDFYDAVFQEAKRIATGHCELEAKIVAGKVAQWTWKNLRPTQRKNYLNSIPTR